MSHVIFLKKGIPCIFFPSMLEYIYVYQKMANHRLDNMKSFYKHKNVYKEIV